MPTVMRILLSDSLQEKQPGFYEEIEDVWWWRLWVATDNNIGLFGDTWEVLHFLHPWQGRLRMPLALWCSFIIIHFKHFAFQPSGNWSGRWTRKLVETTRVHVGAEKNPKGVACKDGIKNRKISGPKHNLPCRHFPGWKTMAFTASCLALLRPPMNWNVWPRNTRSKLEALQCGMKWSVDSAKKRLSTSKTMPCQTSVISEFR